MKPDSPLMRAVSFSRAFVSRQSISEEELFVCITLNDVSGITSAAVPACSSPATTSPCVYNQVAYGAKIQPCVRAPKRCEFRAVKTKLAGMRCYALTNRANEGAAVNAALLQGFYLRDLLVDPVQGLVTGGAEQIHLPPKAMEVLLCLASSPGTMVTREALIDEVWGNHAVSRWASTRNGPVRLKR